MRLPHIPPIIQDIIQTSVLVFDNVEFSHCSGCPQCGGDVQGYDTRSKKFATIREHEKERIITVRVKRFICRSCGTLCYAENPFYPNTQIGSPIVDLFCTLSHIMPASRAARLIDRLGIVVDRTTWRNYRDRPFPVVPAVDVFGMRLPVCIVTLSNIATDSGDTGNADCTGILTACGFPSLFIAVQDVTVATGNRKNPDHSDRHTGKEITTGTGRDTEAEKQESSGMHPPGKNS